MAFVVIINKRFVHSTRMQGWQTNGSRTYQSCCSTANQSGRRGYYYFAEYHSFTGARSLGHCHHSHRIANNQPSTTKLSYVAGTRSHLSRKTAVSSFGKPAWSLKKSTSMRPCTLGLRGTSTGKRMRNKIKCKAQEDTGGVRRRMQAKVMSKL